MVKQKSRHTSREVPLDGLSYLVGAAPGRSQPNGLQPGRGVSPQKEGDLHFLGGQAAVIATETLVEALGEDGRARRGHQQTLPDTGDGFRRRIRPEQGKGIHQLAADLLGEVVQQFRITPQVNTAGVAGETQPIESPVTDQDLVRFGYLHQAMVGGPDENCSWGQT